MDEFLLMNKPPLKTYQKLCTEFYDLELTQDPEAANILAFYMNYALKANGPILEPMCGTGRFLIPMLQANLDIEGFDASPHMLNTLIQKYALISHKQPPVWQQFIEDFENNKLYNLIFIPFGSWGLITNPENSKRCLDIMYRHLAPGGKFVIEIDTIESLLKPCGIWRSTSNTRADGSRLVLNNLTSYEPQTQLFTAICRYESFVDNTLKATETENFQQYLYQFNEMDQLLKNAGSMQIKKYMDYAKTPATDPNTPILIYECTR